MAGSSCPTILRFPVRPDPTVELRAKLQAIQDEFTVLGYRLQQLDDDKAAIERQIKDHDKANRKVVVKRRSG